MDQNRAAKRARKLHTQGIITHAQLIIVDFFLFSCGVDRRTGRVPPITYREICRRCRCARATLAGALPKLERLGLLSRIKRRIAGLQAANSYQLHAEFSDQTTFLNQRRKEDAFEVERAPGLGVEAAQRALAEVARNRAELIARGYTRFRAGDLPSRTYSRPFQR